MKRLLLDSGILSDLINRRRDVPTKIREHIATGERVGTCVPVLAEIIAGIECSQSRDKNMQALLAVMPAIALWPFDEAAAFRYGQVFAELRQLGRPMQVVDMMVASIAFSLGSCLVVTTDSDLSSVPSLHVEIW